MRKARIVRAKDIEWQHATSSQLGKEVGRIPGLESSLKVKKGISSKTAESPRLTMSRGMIPTGVRNPLHYHAHSDVAIHVLKGRFKVFLGPDDKVEEVVVEEGDFIFIPAGTNHAFMNVSDIEPAEFVTAKTVSDLKEPATIITDSKKLRKETRTQ